MPRNPVYLSRDRHGVWHFRVRIPERLRHHFNNKAEIKKSLRTDSRREAVKLARSYRVELDKKMAELEKGIYGAFTVTLEAEHPVTLPDGEIRTLKGRVERDFPKLPTDADTCPTKTFLAKRLESQGKTLREDARAEELHRAKLETLRATVPAPSPQSQPEPDRPPFSEVAARYLEDCEAKGNRPGTLRNSRVAISLFSSIMGDLPFASIKPKHIKEFRDKALRLPARRGSEQYRGLSIKELLNMDIPEVDRRKASTVNRDIVDIGGLWTWANKQNEPGISVGINPCANVDKLATSARDPEKKCFTRDELRLLFESDKYRHGLGKRGFKKPSAFWCPLIALYTGARINEVAQLYLGDIKEVDAERGIYAFDINEYADDKSVKNKKPRKVPVHPKLIEIGLLRYVDELRKKGERRLFPELSYDECGGYAAKVCKDFDRYQRGLGVKVAGRGTHGFRYTFQNALSDIDVSDETISKLSGHARGLAIQEVYLKPKKAALLYEAFKQLDYGLNHPPFYRDK
jgi:integrase